MDRRLKSDMKDWRFLDTGLGDCYRNMAIDEAMLTEHADGNTPPTLRIYGWQPGAFSLGYFQDPSLELDLERCKKGNTFFVRRITGGGVIFHKDELTYSLVCSPSDIGSSRLLAKETFRIICSFLINAYKGLGLDAEFALNKTPHSRKGWFCFSSRERYDILVGDRKIGGNAQRRKKDIIFQHGSIPLSSNIDEALFFLKGNRYIDKTGICSLDEAAAKRIGYTELRDTIAGSFKDTFSVKLSVGALSFREEKLAERLELNKYDTQA